MYRKIISVYCKNHSGYSDASSGQYLEFWVLILADHRVINFSAIELPTKERYKISQSPVYRIKKSYIFRLFSVDI